MTITMTCAIGRFTFDEGVPLALAKQIRDSVMDLFLTQRVTERRIKTVDDAKAFIRASESDLLKKVSFDLKLSNNIEVVRP